MIPPADIAGPSTWRVTIPSWGVSAAVHVAILAWLCSGVARNEKPLGVEMGPDRVVGLVSREFRQSATETQGEGESGETPSQPSRAEADPAAAALKPADASLVAAAPQTGRDALSQEAPPVALDLPAASPAPVGGLGLGAPPVPRRPTDVAEIAQDGAGDGGTGAGESGDATPGKASFFGASAKGERIVYVLDSSGSMQDYGAIDVAKRGLKASLERLTPGQRFQIIFYNNTPRPMAQIAGREDLPRATEVNKARARQFIDSQQPQLGTNHIAALDMALAQKPDVVFLLTDADVPRLSPSELEQIRKRNGGKCQIHTIEFGKWGDLTQDDNFLKKLARQNGGQHRYRDVTRFAGER